MYEYLKIDYKNSYAVITLTRGDKLNPLDLACGKEILKALDEISSKEIRALVITGTGKGFSAGGDIREMLDSVERGEADKFMDELTSSLYEIGLRLRKSPYPVIAAVNGHAAGAGMNLALCCDIVIASEKAVFTQSFSKIALIPGFGGTHLLINQLTWQKACEIAFLGESLNAQTMKEIGLVNRVVPHEDLRSETEALAEKLASGPTLVYARTKELFLKGIGAPFEEHLDHERKYQVLSAAGEDHAIGVRAFMNNEKNPKFSGK